MVVEEVGDELGLNLHDLLEVAGLGVQGELGDVHDSSYGVPCASQMKAERPSYLPVVIRCVSAASGAGRLTGLPVAALDEKR